MDADIEPLPLVEHGLEGAGAFGARYLEPVLRTIWKTLSRRGQLVQVTTWKADRAKEVARSLHVRPA
jgi:hypothetical protein